MAVFIKDATLFSSDDTNHCTLSTVRQWHWGQEVLACIRNSYGQNFLFSYLCTTLHLLSHTNASLRFTLCPSFLPVSSVQLACKASVVFCHYCVMANFFWLLVEALYLNSLLLSSFYHSRRCLWGFSLLGWGEKPWHAVPPTFAMLSCRVWFQYEISHIIPTVSLQRDYTRS